MHPDVGGDVVPLDGCSVAGTPLASEVKVVNTLPSHVTFADMGLCGYVSSFLRIIPLFDNLDDLT